MNEMIYPAKGAIKKKTRRARGNASGLGGEAGRGHKGQKSRTGYSSRSGFEGGQMPLYRRLPKRRGLGNPAKNLVSIVNLETIESFFEEGQIVDFSNLLEKKLVKQNRFLKVLGNGEISKKLTIRAHLFSKSALEKLENAGVTVEKI